jgi:anti-sigma-K factor RskA
MIESYVLGLASAEERSEFEKLCRQYPELLQARVAFELSLEKQAKQNAIAPPAELKQKIFAEINSSAKIVNLSPAPVRSLNWLKYAAAACFILLAGSLYWTISLYNKNKELKNNLDNSIARMNDMEKDMHVIQQNPNIKMAAMKGTTFSPQSFATVYWDTTSRDIYLVINNLPQPASDKQYQLWALLDGKPVDLGLVENEVFVQQKKLLIHMKNAQGAQAFAITLEKKGGSRLAPQGSMYVMGNL